MRLRGLSLRVLSSMMCDCGRREPLRIICRLPSGGSGFAGDIALIVGEAGARERDDSRDERGSEDVSDAIVRVSLFALSLSLLVESPFDLS